MRRLWAALLSLFLSAPAFATPAFNWENDAYGVAAATSVSVTKGAHTISSGHLIFIVVAVENATTDPGAIGCTGSVTQITAGTVTGNTWVIGAGGVAGVRTALFYRYADGTETSFTCSWANSNISSWFLIDYANSIASPFDGAVETDYNAAFTASLVAPAITTATANDLELFVWAAPSYGAVTTPGGSVNARVNQACSSGLNPCLVLADLSIPATGAQATQTATIPGPSASGYEAVSFAIKPSGAVASPPNFLLLGIGK